MKNKQLLIILDPAHGEETSGKRSPDGLHREYLWSRQRLIEIEKMLLACGYKVLWTNKTIHEIGLQNRKNTASQYAAEHPDLVPFLISLHNDAKYTAPKWHNEASGVSVWTSKGRTTSDIFADYFIENIKPWLPKANRRIYSRTTLDKDFEENFTVLMGNYSAILIECMFQDNKDDVLLLQDTRFNKQVEDWIVDSIEKCNEYLVSHIK